LRSTSSQAGDGSQLTETTAASRRAHTSRQSTWTDGSTQVKLSCPVSVVILMFRSGMFPSVIQRR
jgi:hypothetical protein